MTEHVIGRRKEKPPELEPTPVYDSPDIEKKPPQPPVNPTPTASKVTYEKTGNPWRDHDPDTKPETQIIPGQVKHTWTPAEATRSLHEQHEEPTVYTQRSKPAPEPTPPTQTTPTTPKTTIDPDTTTDPTSWPQAHGAKKQNA